MPIALTSLVLAAAARSGPPGWVQFVPLVLILFIFYFLAIRPARKKQLDLQKTIEALKKGDKVVTTGGIFGEIAGVDKTTLIVKIAEGVKIRVSKQAVAGLEGQESPPDQ